MFGIRPKGSDVDIVAQDVEVGHVIEALTRARGEGSNQDASLMPIQFHRLPHQFEGTDGPDRAWNRKTLAHLVATITMRGDGEYHWGANGILQGLKKGSDEYYRQVEELFLDPENYGYCHGMKYVSLVHLMHYKLRRSEAYRIEWNEKKMRATKIASIKDADDAALIRG